MELNMSDPFERAVSELVALNRSKRADYALDADPWSNFRRTADLMRYAGLTALDSVNFNISQKYARLEALKMNDRSPNNESVADTYTDMAVYAIIGMVLAGESYLERPVYGE